MIGATFQQLSQPPLPWAWNGSVAHGKTWFGGPCPSQAIHDCIPPWLDAPVSPVPEESGALMLAAGLVVVWLWARRC